MMSGGLLFGMSLSTRPGVKQSAIIRVPMTPINYKKNIFYAGYEGSINPVEQKLILHIQ